MSQSATAHSVNAPIEQVLVIPTIVFHEVGHFQGFCHDVDRYLNVILDPVHASYRPRDVMEQDPGFKQLIPYCVFQCEGRIFSYTRGTDQGETRLHAKRSVGVGGHVSTVDLNGIESAYLEGMKREIAEEVCVDAEWEQRCVGLINDDESEVGKVHLGVVHLFELKSAQVTPREKSMLQAGFARPEELLRHLDEFETWSQICLKALFADLR